MEKNYDLKNPVHMARFVAREKYGWPGGYELIAITDDGALLCSQCVRDNYRTILHSTKHKFNDGWRIIGITNESELEDDFCSNCGVNIGV